MIIRRKIQKKVTSLSTDQEQDLGTFFTPLGRESEGGRESIDPFIAHLVSHDRGLSLFFLLWPCLSCFLLHIHWGERRKETKKIDRRSGGAAVGHRCGKPGADDWSWTQVLGRQGMGPSVSSRLQEPLGPRPAFYRRLGGKYSTSYSTCVQVGSV